MFELIVALFGAAALTMTGYVVAFTISIIRKDVTDKVRKTYNWSVYAQGILVAITFVLKCYNI